MNKRAYISVFDKTGIVELAKRLLMSGWEIVSTGNTCRILKENGINALESSTITGFDELLGGKVKSLHPKIFASILADENEAKTLDCPVFSLVVVNLYPFEDYKGVNADTDTLVKNIDIEYENTPVFVNNFNLNMDDFFDMGEVIAPKQFMDKIAVIDVEKI